MYENIFVGAPGVCPRAVVAGVSKGSVEYDAFCMRTIIVIGGGLSKVSRLCLPRTWRRLVMWLQMKVFQAPLECESEDETYVQGIWHVEMGIYSILI